MIISAHSLGRAAVKNFAEREKGRKEQPKEQYDPRGKLVGAPHKKILESLAVLRPLCWDVPVGSQLSC